MRLASSTGKTRGAAHVLFAPSPTELHVLSLNLDWVVSFACVTHHVLCRLQGYHRAHAEYGEEAQAPACRQGVRAVPEEEIGLRRIVPLHAV